MAIGRAGDRDIIVSGGWDNAVQIWDATTGQPLGEPLTGHTFLVYAVAIGRVGHRDVILSGSEDKSVRVWDARTGEPLQVLDLLGPALTVACGPQMLAVAVASAVCAFAVTLEA